MSHPELIITYDKIEALCYRYLCGANIRVEFTKDDEVIPYYVVTGKGLEEIKLKIRVAKETHMSNMDMEKGLFELEKHTEKLRNFLIGGQE